MQEGRLQMHIAASAGRSRLISNTVVKSVVPVDICSRRNRVRIVLQDGQTAFPAALNELFADVRADTISQILPVYDNLLRAIDAPCSDEAYAKGVEMTMSQLMTIFDKLGVKPIEALGKTFDPALMNAVMHTEDESLGENVVAEEFQKGFTLGDKVIRHSMVKVAN